MDGLPRFIAFLGGDYIESHDDCEALIRELLNDWTLEPHEDLAIWDGELRVVAVIRGTRNGPKVVRFTKQPTEQAGTEAGGRAVTLAG